jgi:hypothetical protein
MLRDSAHETEVDDEAQGERGADLDEEVPEEEATLEELVEFMNDQLPGALTASGGIFISLRGMCRALGLSSQSQIRRIKSTPTLMRGLRRIPLQHGKGGRQPVNCLRIDKIAVWLATVETAKMRQDTPGQRAFREKIEEYQERLAPVATQVFLRVMSEAGHLQPSAPAPLVVQAESPALLAMAVQIEALSAHVSAVPDIQRSLGRLLEASNIHTIRLENLLEMSSSQEAKLDSLLELLGSQALDLDQAVELLTRYLQSQEDLEERVSRVDARTKRLSPEHAAAVQSTVGLVVRAIQSKNSSITDSLAHKMVYGRLKSRFGPVTSYKEIDDERFEEVMEYLRREYRTVRKEGPEQSSLF